jgi:hypothetical protein
MLLGARQSLWGGAKAGVPTAQDYVQDGLIAMWDGEWNAGGGVHDANATEWKDLIGNHDLTYNGNSISWGDDHVDTYGNNGFFSAASGITSTTPLTMEAVFSIKANAVNNNQILGSNGYGGITLICRGNDLWAIAAGQPYIWTNFGTLTKDKVYAASCTIATEQISYLNGELANSAAFSKWRVLQTFKVGKSGDSSSTCNARFFNVRLYSRALTADEIAANYAIDKERFNLT